ncbi:MAG: glycosyltransferase family 4 protein [Euryarchaeota archaeon]|nr:glycosyltransferase family 4 protein [Euryarchaeota archaeon]
MKILMVLSKNFITDPRVYKEATSLTSSGHNVTVIMWDRHNVSEPQSTVNGIQVISIPTKGLMRWLPNDILRNPFWWRKAYRKGRELYQNEFRFDVVHCHDLDTLQAGVWLKKKLGVKLIYDAHEIFTYMIEKNVSRFVVWYADKMEKRLIEETNHVITVDDGYADYLRNITTRPLTIVRNCKELIGDYQHPSYKIFTLIYIGTLAHSRFFPQMLHVIRNIKNVQLVIIAKKEDNVYTEVKTLAQTYENVCFLDPIPTNQVLSTTKEAHAIVCLFDPSNKLNRIGSPNKLFEAMVTGRPIIVTKGTHAGNIVEKERCGLAIEYSEKALTEAVQLLRDNPNLCEDFGKNGLKAAQKEYNWALQEKNLLHLYRLIDEKN